MMSQYDYYLLKICSSDFCHAQMRNIFLQVVNEGFSVKKHVETKAGAADLVTEFDQRVEEILIKKLQEKFPTHKYVQKKRNI